MHSPMSDEINFSQLQSPREKQQKWQTTDVEVHIKSTCGDVRLIGQIGVIQKISVSDTYLCYMQNTDYRYLIYSMFMEIN